MNAEILIVGGGLAGSAAAIHLARAGRDVLLVEREARAQHKVCGEFLSEETLASLALLGVDVTALGAVSVDAVRLTRNRAPAAASPLPFRAMSLTRCSLDEALLQQAELAGTRVLRGAKVESLSRDGASWSAQTSSGDVFAPSVFLATGKHDLRGEARPPGRQRDLIAFKMYFALDAVQAAALADHVELIVFRGGYAGLQPVEHGAANLCLVVQRAEYRHLGARWENLLAAMQQQSSLLRERLLGAQPLLPRPLAVAPIPYGFVRKHTDGAWYLGDQAAVIPSFTGDGMAIALHSGLLAAEMFLRGASAQAYQRQLHDDVHRQVSFATWISRGLVSPLASMMQWATCMWPGTLRMVAGRTRLKPRRGRG